MVSAAEAAAAVAAEPALQRGAGVRGAAVDTDATVEVFAQPLVARLLEAAARGARRRCARRALQDEPVDDGAVRGQVALERRPGRFTRAARKGPAAARRLLH